MDCRRNMLVARAHAGPAQRAISSCFLRLGATEHGGSGRCRDKVFTSPALGNPISRLAEMLAIMPGCNRGFGFCQETR